MPLNQSKLTAYEWVELMAAGMERLLETGSSKHGPQILMTELNRLLRLKKEMDQRVPKIPVAVVVTDDEDEPEVYFPVVLSPFFEAHVLDQSERDPRMDCRHDIQQLKDHVHPVYSYHDTV